KTGWERERREKPGIFREMWFNMDLKRKCTTNMPLSSLCHSPCPLPSIHVASSPSFASSVSLSLCSYCSPGMPPVSVLAETSSIHAPHVSFTPRSPVKTTTRHPLSLPTSHGLWPSSRPLGLCPELVSPLTQQPVAMFPNVSNSPPLSATASSLGEQKASVPPLACIHLSPRSVGAAARAAPLTSYIFSFRQVLSVLYITHRVNHTSSEGHSRVENSEDSLIVVWLKIEHKRTKKLIQLLPRCDKSYTHGHEGVIVFGCFKQKFGRFIHANNKRHLCLFAKQLEAREADLQKQDAFYREQVARLEERSAQFFKVTTENFHNAADQVNAKYKRYEAYPVCADLQGQILACYKENVGKTLHCSNIAALYLQCVNNAKQNKLRTGG
ncbi:hypothetical protein JOB18_018938, partial [Solea senegalensis]